MVHKYNENIFIKIKINYGRGVILVGSRQGGQLNNGMSQDGSISSRQENAL